ncbi:MAG: chemotaxis protein CheR [Alphaproteobacteria bacterium]|nr:chemotaxis protein CheR [Alphaproteobacteria bacterium]
MTPEDFQVMATLVRDRSGLVLGEDKAYLLESRLAPITRKHGLNSLEDLIAAVKSAKEQGLIADIVEAMTTNESLFFRDTKPFDQLKDLVFPQLLKARAATRQIRIWSAACSSGQEPYSIAMLIKEAGAAFSGWNVEIVATDLSAEMLTKAQSGIYSQFEVQRGLPITLLVKYFKQDGDKWEIDAGLRSMVSFRPFNLLDDPKSLGRFDIVLCRNVLIYFDQDMKRQVLNRISNIMAEDGSLYLGGAETVLGITEKFQPVPGQRGLYQMPSSAPARLSA